MRKLQVGITGNLFGAYRLTPIDLVVPDDLVETLHAILVKLGADANLEIKRPGRLPFGLSTTFFIKLK